MKYTKFVLDFVEDNETSQIESISIYDPDEKCDVDFFYADYNNDTSEMGNIIKDYSDEDYFDSAQLLRGFILDEWRNFILDKNEISQKKEIGSLFLRRCWNELRNFVKVDN